MGAVYEVLFNPLARDSVRRLDGWRSTYGLRRIRPCRSIQGGESE